MTWRAAAQSRRFRSLPLTSESPPYVSVAHTSGASAGTCRVCGLAIYPAERVFVRPYVIGMAHASCGFFRDDEIAAVPGSCFELVAACGRCGDPMYIRHTRPGPWSPTSSPTCISCRIADACLGAAS